MTVTILQGDALERLLELPSDHFHCVVTSPPYWGLRNYGTGAWEGGDPACDHSSVRRGHGDEKQASSKGTSRDSIRPDCRYCGARLVDQQIGLEETPEEWCARLVEVFREVRRVLRPDGVCFVNLGDSYASGEIGRHDGYNPTRENGSGTNKPFGKRKQRRLNTGLKPKDLVGQPWMLAFALRADGWWLRSEIIWNKPNPMPESVRDRPTKSHEQVFLLTKASAYFYDAEAVRETANSFGRQHTSGEQSPKTQALKLNGYHGAGGDLGINYERTARNLRSVWTIATDPLPSVVVDGEKLDHFASYPIELASRCILAGTSAKGCCPECGAPWARQIETEREFHREQRVNGRVRYGGREADGRDHGRATLRTETTGWRPTCSCDAGDPQPCRVLDPFGGSGRTALAAEELQRDCTLIELNPASCAMARAQIERAKARRMIGDDVTRNPSDPKQGILL